MSSERKPLKEVQMYAYNSLEWSVERYIKKQLHDCLIFLYVAYVEYFQEGVYI